MPMVGALRTNTLEMAVPSRMRRVDHRAGAEDRELVAAVALGHPRGLVAELLGQPHALDDVGGRQPAAEGDPGAEHAGSIGRAPLGFNLTFASGYPPSDGWRPDRAVGHSAPPGLAVAWRTAGSRPPSDASGLRRQVTWGRALRLRSFVFLRARCPKRAGVLPASGERLLLRALRRAVGRCPSDPRTRCRRAVPGPRARTCPIG